MTQTLQLEPVQVGNRTIYMHVTPWVARQFAVVKNKPMLPAKLNGVGTVPVTSVSVSGAILAALGVVIRLLNEVGIGHGKSGGVTQTQIGEWAQINGAVASGLATAGSLILSIAYGANSIPAWGQVVCIVLMIVAGICYLIDSFWGTDEDLGYWAVAGDYYKINARLRLQIIEITNHIENMMDGFNQLRVALAEVGLVVPPEVQRPSSLGSTATTALKIEMDNSQLLENERAKRIQTAIDLMKQICSSIKQSGEAINGKDNALRIMLYSLFGLSGLGLLYGLLTSNQKDE